MLKHALSGTVNWETRKWSNFTKFQVFVRDDHQFKQEELESVGDLSEVLLTNCRKMLVIDTNWTT